MIRTRFTERFGLDHPLMSAPMALHSGGTLAGAVSAAGGLGSFGGIRVTEGPEWVRQQVAIVRSATDRPFAVGFITAFLPYTEAFFEATLEESPTAVVLSFGEPEPWASRVRDAGCTLVCQVQTFDDAARAVDAGADVLVAQGSEAGGHTGTMGLVPFLAGVVDRYPDVPVLAAGGIGDGRSLAAVLTAGADGALVGTAFLATPEAVEIDDAYKQHIVDSDGGDTVLTRAYDIVSRQPWPDGIVERVRRNRFTDEWHGREAELVERASEVDPPDEDDPETAAILYGQSARFVRAVTPAAEVVRAISQDAESILRDRTSQLLT